MDFKPAKLSGLENFDRKHVIILVSSGQTKVADLPDHGVVEVISHAGKVTFIEQKTEERFWYSLTRHTRRHLINCVFARWLGALLYFY